MVLTAKEGIIVNTNEFDRLAFFMWFFFAFPVIV